MTTYTVRTTDRIIAQGLTLEEAEKKAKTVLTSVVVEEGPPIRQENSVDRYKREERERRSNNASATPGSRFD